MTYYVPFVPLAKSSLPLISGKKKGIETNTVIHFHLNLWLWLTNTAVGTIWLEKLKIFTIWCLTEKFGDSCVPTVFVTFIDVYCLLTYLLLKIANSK